MESAWKYQVMDLNGSIVLDLCQARFKLETLHNALSEGYHVLYTGSKFFRSPPFCGAVFVPAQIMNRIKVLEGETIPRGLKSFIGKSEIPAELPSWRENVSNSVNTGLALRWTCAIVEIELTFMVDEAVRNQSIKRWRD